MTKQTRNGLIAVAVIGVGAFAVWKFMLQNSRTYARVILRNNAYSGSAAALMTFEEAFLKEWAKAARKNDQTFSYKGKEYKTIGGRAK